MSMDTDISREQERLESAFGGALDSIGQWRLVRADGQRYYGVDARCRVQWTTGAGIDFPSQEHAEMFARVMEIDAKAVRID
jgi:hypothetical protein